jgi:hypothetical protein
LELEIKAVKKIFLSVFLLATVILAYQARAQIASVFGSRGNPLSPIVFVSLPRFNVDDIALQAGTVKRTTFLVNANLRSFTAIATTTPITIKVFNPQGVETQASDTTFIKTETTDQAIITTTFSFPNAKGTGLWELEITPANTADALLSSGDTTPDDSTETLGLLNGMPEIGDTSSIHLRIPGFNANATRFQVTIRNSKTKESTPFSGLHDDGIAPDEVASDGEFSAKLPTDQSGTYTVIADVQRKTRLGEFVSTQQLFEGYTVYPRSAHVIDQPNVSLINNKVNGVPEHLQIEFDLDVTTAGRYAVQVDIGDHLSLDNGFDSSSGNESNDRPFYSSGTHHIILKSNDQISELMTGTLPISFRVLDGNGRVTEKFDSAHPANLSRDQLLPKRFARYNGDKVVDSNNDGEPDAVEVSFNVNIYQAGTYSWSARIHSPKDQQESSGGSGNLGVGLHNIKISIPLTDGLWSEQINGRFKVAFSMQNDADEQSMGYLTDQPVPILTQTYDLTSGITPNPTVSTLRDLIASAKLLRPGEGIREELLASISKIEVTKISKDPTEIYATLSDFLDLFKSAKDKFFSRRASTAILDVWNKLYEVNKIGGTLK